MKVLALLSVLLVSCASAPERELTSPGPAPATPPSGQEEASAAASPAVRGPVGSSRLREGIPDGIAIIDYRATPENERAIDELLSAAGIYFHMAPLPSGGFRVTPPIRLEVTVHREDVQRAYELLESAAEEGRLDVVVGLDDLRQRFGANDSRARLNR